MKSCTLSSGGALMRMAARTGLLPVLAVLGFFCLTVFPNVASAQYSFANAVTSFGSPGNLNVVTAGGNYSTPTLVDLNGDGKLDIVTGNAGGTFRYFPNMGTAKFNPATVGTPSWPIASAITLTDALLGGNLSAGTAGIGRSAPAFVDIDGDGDYDMFSGNNLGQFQYYQNIGTATAPSFTMRTGVLNPMNYESSPGVYISHILASTSTIGFLDTDADGDYDVVAGNSQGHFAYYENEGDRFTPFFPSADPIVPRTNSGRPSPQLLQTGGTNATLNATVCVVDMNCDGVYDILSGTRNGAFQFRSLTSAGPFYSGFDHNFLSGVPAGFPLETKDVSVNTSDYSYPAAGDLDGDGDVDFISGRASGAFVYFQNTTCNTAPTFTPLGVCGSTVTLGLDANGNTEHIIVATDINGALAATSGCSPFDPAGFAFTPDLITCSNIGTPVTVTLQARDNVTGVKSSPTGCTVTVIVEDNDDPVAVCKPFYDIEVGDGNKTLGTIPVSAVEDGSTDNCTSNTALTKTVTYNYSTTIPLDCSNLGITGYEIYLSVEDAQSNSDLTPCVTQVRVVDTKGPVVDVATLPALTREQCNYDAPNDEFLFGFEIPIPTATDRCAPSGAQGAVFVKVNGGAEILASSGVWTPYPDFTVGTYTLTWIYEDAQTPANRTTQTQTLTITAPKLQFANCPTQDVVLDAPVSPSTCAGTTEPPATLISGAHVNWAALNTTGNITLCGGVPTSPVTISKTHTASSVFPYGTTTVYYSAQDGAGNVGNCSFKVIVRDPISQLTVSFPTNFVNTTGTPTNIQRADFLCTDYTSGVPVSQNCSGISVPDDGGTDCGRIVSWTGTPTVTNAQHLCAGPYPVRIEVVSSPNNYHPVGTVVTSGSFFPVGETLLNFVTTDSKGNTYILADFYVEVQNVAPVITCPQPSITVTAPTGQCGANVVVPAATATDNCSGVIITAPYFGSNGGSAFFSSFYNTAYVNTPTSIVFTATDVNGAFSECTVNVYVKDAQKPVFFSCPPSKTITVDVTLGCGEYYNATVGDWIDPYVSDNNGNCGFDPDSVSIVVTHPDFAPVVLDDAINGDPTNYGSGAEFNNSVFTNRNTEHLFNEGTSTVLYTATDFAGNTGTCSFTVTVTDNVAPNVFCPLQPVVRSTVANCRDTLDLGLYNDGLNAITVSPLSGSCGTPSSIAYRLPSSLVNLPASHTFPVGMHSLVVVVTDRSGNSNSCPFQIDVKDLNPPVHTNCPANITVNDTDGGCGQIVTWTGPAFSDDCTAANALTIVRTPNMPSGSLFPIGTTTLSIVARDASLNQSAACFFDVIVNDKTKPVITCPANILKQVTNTDPANCYALVDFTVTATDDCTNIGSGSVNLYGVSGPGGDFEPSGADADLIAEAEVLSYYVPVSSSPLTFTYQAEDYYGNTATCAFTITVEDKQGPVISGCPGNQTTTTVSCAGTAISWTAPTVSYDNCGTGSMGAPNRASGSMFTPGTTVVTYVATDNLGNTRECSFSITVMEGTAPTFTPLVSNGNQPPCNGYYVFIAADDCNGNGTLSTLSQLTPPSATDNCAPTSLTPVLVSGPAPYSAALTLPQTITNSGYSIVWKATDASGNTATCVQTVMALDKTPPVLSCPAFTYTLLPNQTAFDVCANQPTVIVNNTAEDNCIGVLPLSSFVAPPQQCQFPIGTNPFYWNVTDNQGNTSTCTQMITVLGPTSCTPTTGTFSQNSNCGSSTPFVLPNANCPANVTVTAAQLGVSATDNCGNVLALANQTTTFSATGNQTVTFTSPLGNATCSRVVSLTCTTGCNSPLTVSNCPNPTLIQLNIVGSGCTLPVSWTVPTATDPCGGNVTTVRTGPAPGTQFTAGAPTTITYTFTRTSPAATATCSFVVEVKDGQNPTITCPPAITATTPVGEETSDYDLRMDLADLNDNCTPDNALSIVTDDAGIYGVGVYTINYTVTDESGREGTCSQMLTITDETLNCADWTAVGGLVVSNETAVSGDQYGESVDVSGDWAIVGASKDDESAADAGAAYILNRIGGAWVQSQKLLPPTDLNDLITTGDLFGSSVAIDGDYAIVGTYLRDANGANSGAAHIYHRVGTVWSFMATLARTDGAANDRFGFAVDISGDYAVVGAPFDALPNSLSTYKQGSIYIYQRVGSAWTLVGNTSRRSTDVAIYDEFGTSVAIDGDYVIAGAPKDDEAGINSNSGAAFVFHKNTPTANAWGQVSKLLPTTGISNDNFGISVGISAPYAIVGANLADNQGLAYIFQSSIPSSWSEVQVLDAGANAAASAKFGQSVDISGNVAVVGASNYGSGLVPVGAGAAYFFYNDGVSWSMTDNATSTSPASNDNFGYSVAIDDCGAVVGAYRDDAPQTDRGSVYFYDNSCACVNKPSTQIADRTSEQSTLLSGASSVRLFPNPTSDLLNIDVVLETESEVTITVTDAAGRIVSQVFSGVSAPEARYSWDASTVPSGLYFVRVDGGSLRKVVPVSVVK